MKTVFFNEISNYPDYLSDESRISMNDDSHVECIAWPESESDVLDALQKADEHNWPLTVSAARTGIVGAAAPLCGGMVLSVEKLKKIDNPEFDSEKNEWFIVVEPGALLSEIEENLSSMENPKLFYPPDPTEMSAAIGGTVATNASGARTFKFGPTRNYVRRLRIVLADGNLLDLKRGEHFADVSGFICFSVNDKNYKIQVPNYSMPKTKHCAGYFAKPGMDLIDLFIGSEGTLGIFLKIELKILELKKEKLSLLSFFKSENDAFKFVDSLRKENEKSKKMDLEALEFFGGNALKLLEKKREEGATEIHEFPKAAAAIYSEFAFFEDDLETLFDLLEQKLLDSGTSTDESWAGMDSDESERLKQFRHAVPETINQIVGERKRKIPELHKIGTDLAVPDKNFNSIFKFYRETLDAAGLQYAIFGHIGDNHLHVNMMPKNEDELRIAKKYYKMFAEKSVELGGTVSAEHGIGKLKKEFLKILFGEKGVEEMEKVKQVLDPKNILGRGTVL